MEGHVICGDTRSPARLATVLIIPIPTFDASGNSTLPKVNGGDLTKTNLDGNYRLAKIAPGDYFVLAELRGYLSTIAKFRWTELKDRETCWQRASPASELTHKPSQAPSLQQNGAATLTRPRPRWLKSPLNKQPEVAYSSLAEV